MLNIKILENNWFSLKVKDVEYLHVFYLNISPRWHHSLKWLWPQTQVPGKTWSHNICKGSMQISKALFIVSNYTMFKSTKKLDMYHINIHTCMLITISYKLSLTWITFFFSSNLLLEHYSVEYIQNARGFNCYSGGKTGLKFFGAPLPLGKECNQIHHSSC